jgi:hypothetical protein
MPKFNHQCVIAFSVLSNDVMGEDFTPDLLKAALLKRIRELPDDEWLEAVGINDTDPVEEGQD